MKKRKPINPIVALSLIVSLYAFASTLEHDNIEQDKQAQIDVRASDTLYVEENLNEHFIYKNEQSYANR